MMAGWGVFGLNKELLMSGDGISLTLFLLGLQV